MKTLKILTFFMICCIAISFGQNRNLEKNNLNNISWFFRGTFEFYEKHLGNDLKLVKNDTARNIKVVIHDLKFTNLDYKSVTYLFVGNVLTNYSVIFKDRKKPSLKEFCDWYGECTKMGSMYYWKSDDHHITAYFFEEEGEILYVCQRGVVTANPKQIITTAPITTGRANGLE